LKEVADSTRHGATIDSLCIEGLAGKLRALREGTSALQWAATRPEDITPAVAVAVGHFVQVALSVERLERDLTSNLRNAPVSQLRMSRVMCLEALFWSAAMVLASALQSGCGQTNSGIDFTKS
jgi:hypothetical protein